MAKRKICYWDACVFYAWLNNEEDAHGAAALEGIAEMAQQYDANRIVLMSSLVTKNEVFDFKLKTQYARDEFSRRFQRDNFSWITPDDRVFELSRSIRDFHAKKDVFLDSNDAVHLASAILNKADVLYTLDGNSPKPKPNSLLLLDGHKGYPPIKKPFKADRPLFAIIPQSVSAAIQPIQSRAPKGGRKPGDGSVH